MKKYRTQQVTLILVAAIMVAAVAVGLIVPAYDWLPDFALTGVVTVAFAVLLTLRLGFKKPVDFWLLCVLACLTLFYLPGYAAQLIRYEQGTLEQLIVDRYPDLELEQHIAIRPDYQSGYGERTLSPADAEFAQVWQRLLQAEYRTVFPQERVKETYPQDTLALSGQFWVRESDTARRQERIAIYITLPDSETALIRMDGKRNTAYRILDGLDLDWLHALLPAAD